MEKNTYKIVGIINYFNLIPDEPMVVFEGEDKNLYLGYNHILANNFENYYYVCFVCLSSEMLNRIIYLNQLNVKAEGLQERYRVGDVIVRGMIESETNIYLGRIDKYVDYLTSYLDRMDHLKERMNREIEYTKKLVYKMEDQYS